MTSFEKSFSEMICDSMDATFKKYIQGALPPQVLTDQKEIMSILAGMGEADFSFTDDGGLKVSSKRECSVFWNGQKFEIFLRSDK